MKKLEDDNQKEVRMKLMGMGKNSIRKNYYRELLDRQGLLEEQNKQLEDEIKQRVEYENKLKELNDELEERVKERTLELENIQDRLRRTERIASLGALVIGISHELNTPLGNGMMTTSFLSKQIDQLIRRYEVSGNSDEEIIEQLNKIKLLSSTLMDNFKRSSDIVNNFKAVSTEHMTNDRENFNMYQCISSVIFDYITDLNAQNIMVQIDCDKEIVINSYPNLLKQILMNLVSNALKYAFLDNGEILIKFDKRLAEEKYVLMFSDNGRGMSHEAKSRIFDPFFTSDLGKGSGLGMYIVHNLVSNQFEGSIEVVTEREKGTMVKIEFPTS